MGRAVRERGDAEAARRLVVHNLRLVVAIAHQYRRAWANILDLFQEGSVGLLEAIKRWEPTLGPRFGSYAVYWIRAYVLKFLMTNSRLIHVGTPGRSKCSSVSSESEKWMAAGTATPSHGSKIAVASTTGRGRSPRIQVRSRSSVERGAPTMMRARAVREDSVRDASQRNDATAECRGTA